MKRVSYILLLGAGLLLGCRKEDIVDCGPGTASTTTSLTAFSHDYGPAAQSFSFDPAQAQTLTTKNGAIIQVPAAAFQLPSGALPTGPVQLQVKEIYKPADMILAGMPTMTLYLGGKLESGGEFYLRAWQGSLPLRLRPGQSLSLQTPVPTPQPVPGMSLWNFQQQDSSAFDISGWVPDTTTVRTETVLSPAGDLLGTFYNFRFWPENLGWTNVDQYLGTPGPRADIMLNTEYVTPETRVYLLVTGFNSVLSMYAYNAVSWHIASVPAGREMTAVVLQLRGQQLYFGTQKAMVQGNFTFQPILEPLSEAEIVRRVNLL